MKALQNTLEIYHFTLKTVISQLPDKTKYLSTTVSQKLQYIATAIKEPETMLRQ